MTANRHSSVDSTRFIHPKHRVSTPLRATVAKAMPRVDSHSANTAITNR
jgi:hypothetical protein